MAGREIEHPGADGCPGQSIDHQAVVVDRDRVQARAREGQDRPGRRVTRLLHSHSAAADAGRVGQETDRVTGPCGDHHLVGSTGEPPGPPDVLGDRHPHLVEPGRREFDGSHLSRRRVPPCPPPCRIDESGRVRAPRNQVDEPTRSIGVISAHGDLGGEGLELRGLDAHCDIGP